MHKVKLNKRDGQMREEGKDKLEYPVSLTVMSNLNEVIKMHISDEWGTCFYTQKSKKTVMLRKLVHYQ